MSIIVNSDESEEQTYKEILRKIHTKGKIRQLRNKPHLIGTASTVPVCVTKRTQDKDGTRISMFSTLIYFQVFTEASYGLYLQETESNSMFHTLIPLQVIYKE